MTVATFRFYARLNAFLPADRRGEALEYACSEQASIKHMVEVLGVPHTEIALLLANGEPASLDQPVKDGDRIAVYPKFETLDISGITRIPRLADGMPRFIADAHLGALARLLRMTGFNTRYENRIADPDIARLACEESRILLTRDRDLLKHRIVEHGCYVHAIKPQEQLQELFDRLDLHPYMQPFSRCLKCNSLLQPVSPEQVADRLPPRVRERHTQFWRCSQCDKLYWAGTHWQDMRQMLSRLIGA